MVGFWPVECGLAKEWEYLNSVGTTLCGIKRVMDGLADGDYLEMGLREVSQFGQGMRQKG